ncbi:GMC oxidoreductase [Halobacteriovorax sp. GB3]|uniref:GMC oxidoreductase n=1 Tax=Halobacteriovorax sp. GB3 TaxID=2719615 RepID=UPI0023616761|nr:GMC oxidoreductase [Halobacteriovorax sp. GB3]MDD0854149.1 GMC oxidoreductase [Halobacteriovorax sp. GB3]
MIFNKLDKSITEKQYDLCIIGAGPSGITLALDISRRSSLNVLLLEAGDLNFSDSSQDFYKPHHFECKSNNELVKVADKYLSRSRMRTMGGTSTIWDGWVKPLDSIDFKGHWPISKKDLDPYYSAVSPLLGLSDRKPFDKIFNTTSLRDTTLEITKRANFKEVFLKDLAKEKGIDLYLNTAITNCSITKKTITSIDVTNGSSTYQIKAKHIVLAAGGIESTRILLNWNKEHNISNTHLGKYFHEHLIIPLEKSLYLYNDFTKKPLLSESFKRGFSLKEKIMIDNQLLNFSIYIDNLSSNQKEAPTNKAKEGKLYDALLFLEMTPVQESSITLSKLKDKFSLNKINLNWKISENDFSSIPFILKHVDTHLNLNKIGKLRQELPSDYNRSILWEAHHHMGTTRLGKSKKEGVVDKNLRSFDYENLYILSSSVYPYSGYSNPTMTLLALSIRLSNYLRNLS